MALQRADDKLERPLRRARGARPFALPRRRNGVDEALGAQADGRRIRDRRRRRSRGRADDPPPGLGAGILGAGDVGRARKRKRARRSELRHPEGCGARHLHHRHPRFVGQPPRPRRRARRRALSRRSVPRAVDAGTPAAGGRASGQPHGGADRSAGVVSLRRRRRRIAGEAAHPGRAQERLLPGLRGLQLRRGRCDRRPQRGRRRVRTLRRLYIRRSRLRR